MCEHGKRCDSASCQTSLSQCRRVQTEAYLDFACVAPQIYPTGHCTDAHASSSRCSAWWQQTGFEERGREGKLGWEDLSKGKNTAHNSNESPTHRPDGFFFEFEFWAPVLESEYYMMFGTKFQQNFNKIQQNSTNSRIFRISGKKFDMIFGSCPFSRFPAVQWGPPNN